MDHAVLAGLLDQLEEEDNSATGKKGLAVLDGGKNGPADSDGSNKDDIHVAPGGKGDEPGQTLATEPGDKLAALVASLSPEEKAKLRTLLDADSEAAPPGEE